MANEPLKPHMFNLEKAISDWRRQLAASGITSSDILDQLQTHLRDELDKQMGAGLSQQRAFELALEQIGQIVAISAEFSKVAPARLMKRPKYLLPFSFCSAALITLSSLSVFLEPGFSSFGRMLGFVVIWLIALYLAALPFCYRFLPSIHRLAVRKAIEIGSLLLAFWCLLAVVSSSPT